MNSLLSKSIEHSFIDRKVAGTELLKAKLFTNSRYETQLLPQITDYLKSAETFDMAVAFVTKGGLSMLKTTLLDLARKGIGGRLLTSDYLDFNDPAALEELLKIRNLEVRLSGRPGFHAKGYFFHFGDYSNVIIGSSNLTAAALKKNYEWNLRISSGRQGDIYNLLKHSFDHEWEESATLTQEAIETYRSRRIHETFPFKIDEPEKSYIITAKEPQNGYVLENSGGITPNAMQVEAMASLKSLREKGENKAIIISATGSGKTYLTAFDVAQVRPARLLFLAHREQVLYKAIADYKKIMPESTVLHYGVLSGNSKQTNANYLFSMVQTLSQKDCLRQFSEDEFDYIVIDEVHRSGAPSYRKILDHFHPKFLLGITATPERTDGFNIFELFDHNIAYEIRLHDALEMDIVSPFHYFGVSDYEMDGQHFSDVTDLRYLVGEDRVNFLLEKIDYYGYSGSDGPKGLVFCSTLKEAESMAEEFNKRGIPSTFLSGGHSQQVRQEAIRALECGALRYIDIFLCAISSMKVLIFPV